MKFITKKQIIILLFILVPVLLFLSLTKLQIIKEKMSYKYYEKANELASQGEIDSAIFYYEKAIKIDPDNYIFYFSAAEESEKVNRINEAQDYYKKVLMKNPNKEARLLSYVKVTSIYILKQEYSLAIKLSQDIIKNKDNDYFEKYIHLIVGFCYTLSGEKDEALVSLTKSSQFKDSQEINFEKIGITDNKLNLLEFGANFLYELLYLKNYDDLIEKINKSEIITTSQKNIFLGQIYYELQDYDKAINYLSKVEKEKDFNYSDENLYLLMIGSSFLEKNEIEKSEKYFNQLIEHSNSKYQEIKSPGYSVYLIGAYLGLSECELKKNNPENALNALFSGTKFFQERTKINNYYDKINFYRFFIMTNYKISEIYILNNNSSEAIFFLEKINEIKKEIPDEIWNKINKNYWPKEKDITLEEKINSLKELLNNE
jgi:tetratricopeptide (TPR) repeat protein